VGSEEAGEVMVVKFLMNSRGLGIYALRLMLGSRMSLELCCRIALVAFPHL
jgi:hypothetical protein